MWYSFFNSSWDDLFDKSEETNWEELKKTGKVEETEEVKDKIKTITKTYVSNDGVTKITSKITVPVIDENEQKILEIDKQIQEAVKKEEYERASDLKKQKDKIVEKNKQLKEKGDK